MSNLSDKPTACPESKTVTPPLSGKGNFEGDSHPSLHAEFKQWLLRAHREGEISFRAFLLGDILLRYIAVLEQVPDPSPAVKAAAENALRDFQEAVRTNPALGETA